VKQQDKDQPAVTERNPGALLTGKAMEPSHRSHRHRKKKSAGKLGLAGAATGVFGVMLVAVAIVLLRSADSGGAGTKAPGEDGAPSVHGGLAGPVRTPPTGPPLRLRTPEGFGYSVAAVHGATNDQPFPTGHSPLPAGSTYAYVDYVLTNTGNQQVLLDFPGDMFVRRDQVPAAARARCMPQPGVPGSMCTLPNHSAVIGYVNGSKPPIVDSGDQYMPPGAAYLVRVATTMPVVKGLQQSGMNLFVWDARYISDRRAVEVPFP
jgi:hypothetical protein